MAENKGRAFICTLLAVAALSSCALLLVSVPAFADHSLGNSCISCHSLRSGKIIAGSRNVREDMVDDDLYIAGGAPWPCGDGIWKPATDGSPLDCGYCHNNDIGLEIQTAKGGKHNPGIGVGSSHPVEVAGNGPNASSNPFFYPETVRIYCNDCHSGNDEVTPRTMCSKDQNDGYPNHKNIVENVDAQPGTNDLVNNPPRLTGSYGTDVNWSAPTFKATKKTFDDTEVLCFMCHDNDDSTDPPYATEIDESNMTNIMGHYNDARGGHNVSGIGDGVGGIDDRKVACYHCHDPHAATDTDPSLAIHFNDALITNTAMPSINMSIPNAYDSTNTFTFGDYEDGNGPFVRSSHLSERQLCLNCHDSAPANQATLENNKAVPIQETIDPANLQFGFHARAHSQAFTDTDRGCLQENMGCHYSVHNNSPYNCLECHSSIVQDRLVAAGRAAADVNPVLEPFIWVDSEYGWVGYVQNNYAIKSNHNIDYVLPIAATDMTNPDANGCLYCHDVPSSFDAVDSPKVQRPDGTLYTEKPATTPENRGVYNDFCLGCHDNVEDVVEYMDGIYEDYTDANEVYPPNVKNHYEESGHGKPKNENYLVSDNPGAEIPCVECHMYHGSTAYKLLPGDAQAPDFNDSTAVVKGARTVKGYDYGHFYASTLPIGDTGTTTFDSTMIDYTDYTRVDGKDNETKNKEEERGSIKFHNYLDNEKRATYYTATDNQTAIDLPTAATFRFGTSGDRVADGSLFVCGDDIGDASASQPIGFCDVCHLDNGVTGTTFGKFATHGAFNSGSKCVGPDFNQDHVMQKDCTECHDPHGSGDDSVATPDANLYMIRGQIATGVGDEYDADIYNVVFKAESGPDSYSEAGDTDNKDDLCAVCHIDTAYNFRNEVGDSHNEGSDCMRCHSHTQLFMPGGCNGCHGFPPVPIAATSNVPPAENYPGGGGPHLAHVKFLADVQGIPYKGTNEIDPFEGSEDPKVLCGPCHGDGAGADDTHFQANAKPTPDLALGAGPWGDTGAPYDGRPYITIKERGSTSWGGSPTYGGQALPVSGTETTPRLLPGDPMDAVDSRCANVDCHGTNETYDELHLPPKEMVPLYWSLPQDDTGIATPGDGYDNSRVCGACHDATPAALRVYDKDDGLMYGPRGSGAAVEYVSPSVDAAANYFGTVSGYGRGGHGDARISSSGLDEDSSALDTPIDCSACHSINARHFPIADTVGVPGVLVYPVDNRLINTVLEESTHANNDGLCNWAGCHAGTNYPGDAPNWRHHPSYVPLAGSWPAPTNTDVSNFTNWVDDGISRFTQDAYGAAGTVNTTSTGQQEFPGNIDRFIDWYNRGSLWNPSSGQDNERLYAQGHYRGVFLGESGLPGVGGASPKATMPLKLYTLDIGGDDNYIICVTCHNPHGTDLFIFDDQGGAGKDMADHNMLRLQQEDSTLCNACH